jgi:hypothetical protein
VRAALAAGGYKAVELEGLDQRLREAGVTEGAHLASLKPSQAAKAAGAKRLLYGEVEAFGMLNVGLYRRRHVRLKLRLTDERGRELWSSFGEGFREDAVEPKDAAVGFGLGVAEKLLERATRSFLEDESKEAVRIALETLPRLPAAPPGS